MVSKKDQGRSREAKAAKKQARLQQEWTPKDHTLNRYVRCWICGTPMAVNNNEQRKVKVPRSMRVGPAYICARHCKSDVRYYILALKLAREDCRHFHASPCPCLTCVAERLVSKEPADDIGSNWMLRELSDEELRDRLGKELIPKGRPW